MTNFPLSIQSFEKLRQDGCVYVDKTDYVYNLAHHGCTYFLARPRRFGKSLMCNTLRAFFEGKKHLFEGLIIYDLEKDWTAYPILYLDFVSDDYTVQGTLMKTLMLTLENFEKEYGIVSDKDLSVAKRFEYDLKAVYDKTGLQTVIIVDEYDNPLIKSVDLEADKNIYRGFFSVLKSADRYIRFAFLTGVTKFAKTSIFSGTNQPVDISLNPDFSAICGITHKELTDYCTNDIQAFADKKGITFDAMLDLLKKWYDCYQFHEEGTKVFNPVSLFTALQSKD